MCCGACALPQHTRRTHVGDILRSLTIDYSHHVDPYSQRPCAKCLKSSKTNLFFPHCTTEAFMYHATDNTAFHSFLGHGENDDSGTGSGCHIRHRLGVHFWQNSGVGSRPIPETQIRFTFQECFQKGQFSIPPLQPVDPQQSVCALTIWLHPRHHSQRLFSTSPPLLSLRNLYHRGNPRCKT